MYNHTNKICLDHGNWVDKYWFGILENKYNGK